ncbi:MAG: dockerin type I domain-containing protein [Candidatus Zixiibacteriota bacterium]
MRRTITAIVLCFLFVTSSVIAEQAITYTYQSRFLENYLRDIQFDGDIGYCSYSGIMRVYDFSDPTNPVLLSRLDIGDYVGGACDFALTTDYAYVPISNSGVLILDKTDPYQLFVAGFYAVPELLSACVVKDNYLYVAKRFAGTIILDISTPTAPTQVSTVPPTSYTNTYGLKLFGDILALNHDFYGFDLYNVSDPANPVFVRRLDQYGNESDIEIVGPYAYVTGRGYGLVIYNISNLSNPVQHGTYDPPLEDEYVEGVAISGTYAYLTIGGYSAGYNGFRVIDISNPNYPSPVANGPINETYRDIFLHDDNVYAISNDRGLKIFDTVDPNSPALIGSALVPFDLQSIAVSGDRAYVMSEQNYSTYDCDFYIYDISDRTNPVALAEYPDYHHYTGWDIAAIDNLVYICYGSVLQILDATDPTNLTVLFDGSIGAGLLEFEIQGNYLYGVDLGSGLFIYDISDPTSPLLTNSVTLGDALWDVEVEGNYAYVSQNHGVFVVDVTDPYAPFEAGEFYYFNLHVRGMRIAGEKLYVVSQTAELMILDVSDPVNPVYLGQSGTYNDNSSLFALNDLVLATNSGGLSTFDVYTPTTPVFILSEPHGPSEDAAIDDNYIYTASRNGVNILAYTMVSAVYGDVDQSGSINIGDAVYLLNYIFKAGDAPVPLRAGDANCDETVNIGDVIHLVNYIFRGGLEPGCD